MSSLHGRCGIVRVVLVITVCWAILWACSLAADYRLGLMINVVVGAVGGLAAGAIAVATVRRLRDAGFGAPVILLVLALLFGLLVERFLLAPTGNNLLAIALVVCVAVLLLWPSRPTPPEKDGPGRGGLIVVATSVLFGILLVGGIAFVSIGMQQATRDRIQWEATHPHGEANE